MTTILVFFACVCRIFRDIRKISIALIIGFSASIMRKPFIRGQGLDASKIMLQIHYSIIALIYED